MRLVQRNYWLTLALAGLIVSPPIAHAQPSPDADKVEQAKISLEAAAALAAGSPNAFPAHPALSDSFGSAAKLQAARWWMISFSIGWCREYSDLQMINALNVSLARALPNLGAAGLSRIRQAGMRFRQQGASLPLPGTTRDEQAEYCLVELQAAREVLAEL